MVLLKVRAERNQESLSGAPGSAISSGIVEERRHSGCKKTPKLHKLTREDESRGKPGREVSEEERYTSMGSKGGEIDIGLV